MKNSRIGFYATLLAGIEVGLGSFLHAFHCPCTGYFLSLNQIFLISRATYEHPDSWRYPYYISNIAAMFKSLAPMGKKITPMLALSMQGLLYTAGLALFGVTLPGRLLGASLSALWGFLQPLLIYYAIFGKALFLSISEYAANWGIPLGYLIGVVVLLKITLAMTMVVLAKRLSPRHFERYAALTAKELPKGEAKRDIRSLLRKSVKDLCKVPFLLSLALTASFFYFSKHHAQWFLLGVMRPVSVGFACFFLLRIPSRNMFTNFVVHPEEEN